MLTANRFSKVILIAGAMALAVVPLPAQESTGSATSPASESSREQLRAIEKEIQALREQASRLAEQENSVITMLHQYDVEYQMKAHEIQWLDLRQQKTELDLQGLQNQLGELEASLAKQREHLSRRLVEAYKLGRLNYVKLMLQTSSASDLLQAYQYVTFLARDDSRRLDHYRKALKEKEDTKIRFEQENRNLAQLRQDLEQAHSDLLKSRVEKARLLASIQNERETHLSTLTELKAAASQLQGFFVEQRDVSSVAPLSGVDIVKFRGALDWPVRGQLVREFGSQKHPRFGTTTMSNGIEIEAADGDPVTAVYEGQVLFSEWFKGYGKSIIISHAGGIYTLYAHNSELLVQRGDSVQRGQLIAKVGSTGSLSGPNLYFEIRDKEQPVNPLLWLRKSYMAGRK
jgi:septal ring factor EnvC (AmiA/AmiB activator)